MSDISESQHLAVIRVWAALAWADGVIQDSERAAITKLIAIAQLSDDERTKAKSYLDFKVELETEGIANLSQAAREGVYRAALRLAHVDLDRAQEETAMLTRLRDGLDINAETALAIEKSLSPS